MFYCRDNKQENMLHVTPLYQLCKRLIFIRCGSIHGKYVTLIKKYLFKNPMHPNKSIGLLSMH